MEQHMHADNLDFMAKNEPAENGEGPASPQAGKTLPGAVSYFQALTRMLGAPGSFFREMPQTTGFRRPFHFLLASSLFFTGASLTCMDHNRLVMAVILMVNALGMAFISAGASLVVLSMFSARRIPYSRLFAVNAYASGVTLLASWIPLFVFLTEPWKWCLITVGLVRACGLKWHQAIVAVGASIVLVFLFFWSLSPLVIWLRGV